MVLNIDSTPCGVRTRSGTSIGLARRTAASGLVVRRVGRRRRVLPDLVLKRAQLRVPRRVHLALQPVEEQATDLAQVHQPSREPVRVQREPEHVRPRPQQVLRHALHEHGHAPVPGQHVPASVDDHRRVGLVRGQHDLDRGPHGRHVIVVEAALPVGGGVPGCQQQGVALAQWDVEGGGQAQDHLPARARPARLHAGQVPCGGVRGEREIELAEPAPPAPLPQQGTGPGRLLDVHAADPSRAGTTATMTSQVIEHTTRSVERSPRPGPPGP